MGPTQREDDMFGGDWQAQLQTDRQHMGLFFSRDAADTLPMRYGLRQLVNSACRWPDASEQIE